MFALGCTSALTPAFGPDMWRGAPAAIMANNVSAMDMDAAPDMPEMAPVLAEMAPAAPAPVAQAAPEPVPELPKAPIVLASADTGHYPLNLDLKVQNGDTLISLLTDSGVSYDEAHSAVESVRTAYDPRKLDIGQNISVKLDKGSDGPVLASLSVPVSVTSALRLTRDKDNGFNVKKVSVPVEQRLARAGGRIENSLYETGKSAGIPHNMLSEIISAYSYDVDFQRDIQPGDSVDVLFEKRQTKAGADAGNGNMLYAELDLGDRVLKLYRYTDKDGNADYYNEKGESIRKALLRTPINGARITSAFGMRMHPLLGYSKMHRGVDFGAATGTPIYAAGDGTVDFIGAKGGYGNYLRIRHNGTYSTAYGHISRFASGMAPGKKVKQGQIIAYVGSTGMATGPHLHYEILANNDQVNPANVKFKTGAVLAGKELLAFRQSKQKIEAQLASLPQNGGKLAMNTTSGKNEAN